MSTIPKWTLIAVAKIHKIHSECVSYPETYGVYQRRAWIIASDNYMYSYGYISVLFLLCRDRLLSCGFLDRLTADLQSSCFYLNRLSSPKLCYMRLNFTLLQKDSAVPVYILLTYLWKTFGLLAFAMSSAQISV